MTHIEQEQRDAIQQKIVAVHRELESAAFQRGAGFVLKRLNLILACEFTTRDGRWCQEQIGKIIAEVERSRVS